MHNKMVKFIVLASVFFVQSSVMAITPTFHVNKDIYFGILLPTTGSCVMYPSGYVAAFQGEFLCILAENAQLGSYTITANPNKTVKIKILPNLDHGDGIIFNARASLRSDVEVRSIFNNSDFIEINSGDSGIINIDLGGELIINSAFPSGQTVPFNFDAAIQWEEVE